MGNGEQFISYVPSLANPSSPKTGEQQQPGGQATFLFGMLVWGCGRNLGYQRRNTSSSSPLRTFVRVCSSRCAPRSVHCICCFLTERLLTTWLMVDSTNAGLIVSPCRYRSPKLGMDSRLLRMYVSNSAIPAASFSAGA